MGVRPVRAIVSVPAALFLAAGGLFLGASAPAVARGPESLADEAAAVSDAVVNISATQRVDEKTGEDAPDLQKGTPFDDLFDEYFKKRQQGKGGADDDPAWADNFRQHPEVDLQDKAEKHTYRVRELSGEERDDWWQHAVDTWPTYAEYQEKTERLIPLFLLERVEE